MKFKSFVSYEDGAHLKEEVGSWIDDNEKDILEVVDIEYNREGNIYLAIVTYIERAG
ncbi:MAG TPA: hypothetical protein VK071_04165 [Tissierellales bacterium]|nr:hypothetical protein [Tissierellales bacterium]